MWDNLKGKVISFEGGEGAGKSTVMGMLFDELKNEDLDVIRTREPGGNNISEQIRKVIVNPENTSMCPETECLLYAASRAQLVKETLKPLLNTEKTILFDRFIDSSYVYQGFVRELGIEKVKEINDFACEGFLPDVTILFDIDPELGFKRIAYNNRSTNRLDMEGIEFHQKVREGYHKLAEMFPERIKMIDASRLPEDILNDILDILKTI